jgi:hypothetical protein
VILFQLFRRVAAALPGMDSTENKPPEDSILFLCKKYLNAIDTYNNFPKAQLLVEQLNLGGIIFFGYSFIWFDGWFYDFILFILPWPNFVQCKKWCSKTPPTSRATQMAAVRVDWQEGGGSHHCYWTLCPRLKHIPQRRSPFLLVLFSCLYLYI